MAIETSRFGDGKGRLATGEVYKELNSSGALEGAVVGLIHGEDNGCVREASVMYRKKFWVIPEMEKQVSKEG